MSRLRSWITAGLCFGLASFFIVNSVNDTPENDVLPSVVDAEKASVPSPTNADQSTAHSPKRDLNSSRTSHSRVLNQDVSAGSQTKNIVDTDPTETDFVDTAETPELWQTGRQYGLDYTTFPHTKVLEFDAVGIDAEAVLLAEPGQSLRLPLPSNRVAQVTVKQSKIDRLGNVTVSGYLDGFGDRYPFVITYSEQSTFAMVTNPSGSYSVETVNGIGWIYKNPNEHELSAPGYNDSKIPQLDPGKAE